MKILFVTIVAALAIVSGAFAAKPAGVNYSISLDQTSPAFGDQVTFTYSPDPSLGNIVLECFQNGVLVSSEQHGANAEAWSYHNPFTLGGTYLWSSGPANCVARLDVIVHGHNLTTVATTSFNVSG